MSIGLAFLPFLFFFDSDGLFCRLGRGLFSDELNSLCSLKSCDDHLTNILHHLSRIR